MPKQRKDSSNTVKITTPTPYGSHKSMVVKELDNDTVLCKDDRGEYITQKSYLDSNLADPHRNNGKRIKKDKEDELCQ